MHELIGKKFERLTVIGRGGWVRNGKGRTLLWQLQCDCGNIVELRRSNFDRKGQSRTKSCGCLNKEMLVPRGQMNVKDFTGLIIGKLTAIRSTGNKKRTNYIWEFICECGSSVFGVPNDLYWRQKIMNRALTCTSTVHTERRLRYPPTPNPYPADAAKILEKYLYLTKCRYKTIDQAVEDDKINLLIRASWIVAYKHRNGQIENEVHERYFIKKHLRYSHIRVALARFRERRPTLSANIRTNKTIGSSMTNSTLTLYPLKETRGNNPHGKKIKFCRR